MHAVIQLFLYICRFTVRTLYSSCFQSTVARLQRPSNLIYYMLLAWCLFLTMCQNVSVCAWKKGLTPSCWAQTDGLWKREPADAGSGGTKAANGREWHPQDNTDVLFLCCVGLVLGKGSVPKTWQQWVQITPAARTLASPNLIQARFTHRRSFGPLITFLRI